MKHITIMIQHFILFVGHKRDIQGIGALKQLTTNRCLIFTEWFEKTLHFLLMHNIVFYVYMSLLIFRLVCWMVRFIVQIYV